MLSFYELIRFSRIWIRSIRHFCQDYVLFVLQSWTLWHSPGGGSAAPGGPMHTELCLRCRCSIHERTAIENDRVTVVCHYSLNVCVSARLCVQESVFALRAVMSSPKSPQDPGALSSRSSAEATWISCSKSTFWLIWCDILNTLFWN